MKLHLDLEHGILDIDRQPLPPERFKAILSAVFAGIYTTLTVSVVKLCGLPGLIAVGVLGGIVYAIAMC